MEENLVIVRCKNCCHQEECSWTEFLGEDGFCSAGEEYEDED